MKGRRQLIAGRVPLSPTLPDDESQLEVLGSREVLSSWEHSDRPSVRLIFVEIKAALITRKEDGTQLTDIRVDGVATVVRSLDAIVAFENRCLGKVRCLQR